MPTPGLIIYLLPTLWTESSTTAVAATQDVSQSKIEWIEMYIHGALKLYKDITDHPAICTESNYSKVYI